MVAHGGVLSSRLAASLTGASGLALGAPGWFGRLRQGLAHLAVASPIPIYEYTLICGLPDPLFLPLG